MTERVRKTLKAAYAVGSPGRYVLVGAANTLFGLSIYWFLIYVGVDYPWASAASLVSAIVLGFQTHGRVVFAVRGRFLRYVVVWTLIYFVSIALIAASRNRLGDYVAGVALLPITTLLGFVLMKRFVFPGVPSRDV